MAEMTLIGILKESTCQDLCYPENHDSPSLWFERTQTQYKGQTRKGVSWTAKDPTVHLFEVVAEVKQSPFVTSVNKNKTGPPNQPSSSSSRTLGSRDNSGKTFFESVRDAIENDLVDPMVLTTSDTNTRPATNIMRTSRCSPTSPTKPVRKPSLDFGNDCMAEFESLWEDASSSHSTEEDDAIVISEVPSPSQKLSSTRSLETGKPSTATAVPRSGRRGLIMSGASKRSQSNESRSCSVDSTNDCNGAGCELLEPPVADIRSGNSRRRGILKKMMSSSPSAAKNSAVDSDSSETEVEEFCEIGGEDGGSYHTGASSSSISDKGARKRFLWLNSKHKKSRKHDISVKLLKPELEEPLSFPPPIMQPGSALLQETDQPTSMMRLEI